MWGNGRACRSSHVAVEPFDREELQIGRPGLAMCTRFRQGILLVCEVFPGWIDRISVLLSRRVSYVSEPRGSWKEKGWLRCSLRCLGASTEVSRFTIDRSKGEIIASSETCQWKTPPEKWLASVGREVSKATVQELTG